MHTAYTLKLGFRTKKINNNKQKIDEFYLNTFEILIVNYLIKNKLKRVRFFKKTILLANIGLETVLRICFLTFSRANIRF